MSPAREGLDPDDVAARYPMAGRGDGSFDLEPPEPLAGVRVWSRDGRVVLVELDQPVAPGGPEAVLDLLGPADLARWWQNWHDFGRLRPHPHPLG